MARQGFKKGWARIRRGYHAVYRPQACTHCPGCGRSRSRWIDGGLLAECAFCVTALPLADAA